MEKEKLEKSKNSEMNLMESYPCQLKDLNLSCYGCCGVDFGSEEEVSGDLFLNTNDFNKIQSEFGNNEDKLKKFRDRFSDAEIGSSGVCMNLVDFGSGCEACPLHPFINKIVSKNQTVAPSSDLRVGYCDTKYECETVKFWNYMKLEQRKEFFEFVKSKKYSNHEYSMKNESGELIKEFLGRNEFVD